MKRVAMMLLTAALTLAAFATVGCSSPEAPRGTEPPVELNISAAATLRSVLTSTAPAFEESENVRLVFNFGASGQLVKQIEGGAPADVILSASPDAIATLVAGGLASAEESAAFAGNTLVILVPAGNPAGIYGPGDLARADRLTTGDPAVAPYGQKAREWLTGLGLWDEFESRAVFAANAAQGDDYISRGEVDAGIGFASDARGRDDIEIAYTVPAGTIKPIEYVGAPLAASSERALAEAYLSYLLSPEVQKAFVSGGFTPAGGVAD